MKATKVILGIALTGFCFTAQAGIGDFSALDHTGTLYEEAFNSVFNDDKSAMIDSFGSDRHCCKIYNSDNELVHMSRDKNDPRLQDLKRRSDLIMYTESSSYYLLTE